MLHQHILLPSLFVYLTTRPTYTQVGGLGQGSSEKTQLPLPSEQVRLIHQVQKYRFSQKNRTFTNRADDRHQDAATLLGPAAKHLLQGA